MPPAERARRREREDNRRGERAQLVVLAGRERTRVEDTEREEYGGGVSGGGVSGGGGESAEIDLRQLKRAKAAGAKTLESSMKTNNLRDFMSRSSATVARGCPGPDEGRGHPFVDAMSKYAWAQHAHVVPMESQEQKDERWSNPAEYALLGEGHPRRGTMMIHLRGMARSSTQTRAKGLADRVIADRVGSRGIACDRVGSRGIADRVGSRGIA